MLIFKEKVKENSLIAISEYYNPNEIIFFDIETTGLSAERSMLYIIGYNYYENGSWYIVQLFNDDGNSESEMLEYFMDILASYKYIIHFNGDMFDIPYVTKRIEKLCTESAITNRFRELISIDLYKTFRPFKKALGMDSLKQKSFEKYLGVNRDDIYSGGELIQIYFSYLRIKSEESRRLLLLHNRDDMEGMLFITSLLSLISLKNGEFSLEDISVSDSFNGSENMKINFKISLKHSFPKNIYMKLNDIKMNISSNNAIISIPVISGEMKYYYEDYKEYYYIPDEDTAIHKSAAEFIDRSRKVKATKATCYIRRAGYFITQLDRKNTDSFKTDIKSKESYIEISDDFLGKKSLIEDYLKYMVKKLLSG